jgi:hypothetical protein
MNDDSHRARQERDSVPVNVGDAVHRIDRERIARHAPTRSTNRGTKPTDMRTRIFPRPCWSMRIAVRASHRRRSGPVPAARSPTGLVRLRR